MLKSKLGFLFLIWFISSIHSTYLHFYFILNSSNYTNFNNVNESLKLKRKRKHIKSNGKVKKKKKMKCKLEDEEKKDNY